MYVKIPEFQDLQSSKYSDSLSMRATFGAILANFFRKCNVFQRLPFSSSFAIRKLMEDEFDIESDDEQIDYVTLKLLLIEKKRKILVARKKVYFSFKISLKFLIDI